MKKIALSIAIIAAVFTGCTIDDETEVVKVPVTGEITGDLTVSKTYAYGNYTLKGFAKVASGVTITFEAGSTITADKADGEDAFDRMIESIGIGTLVYYSESSLIKDLPECGKTIWNNAEYKLENNLL